MKPYFAQYIPVEGEIQNNSWVKSPNDGAIWQLNGTKEAVGFAIESMQIPVKLMLCSRNVQIGDKAYDENGNTCPLCNGYGQFPIESSVSDGFEECIICAREYKIIGEISPDALAYVKEGQEFEESEVKIYIDYAKTPAEKVHVRIKCHCCNKFN